MRTRTRSRSFVALDSRGVLALIVAAVTAFGACGADDDTKVDAGADGSSTTEPIPVESGLVCPADDADTTTTVGETTTSSAPSTTTPVPSTDPGTDPGADPGADPSAEAFAQVNDRGEPKVSVPDEPVTELCIIDDVVGTGDPVPEDATITAHFVVAGQSSGTVFQSSWTNSTPLTAPITDAVAGFKQGVVGMQAGGRRTIVVPADLAWGETPPEGSGIKPGETVVFVIDLISFEAPPPPPEPVKLCEGTTPGPKSKGEADVAAEITARGKPTPTIPDAPATEMCAIDEIVGTGDEVPAGVTVTVQYVGVGQQSKTQFDASWDRGEPATFGLDQVIRGWTLGIPGMRVGGRRTLIIPGELAYGESPPSGDIAANETLIFTIDMISFTPAGAAPPA